MSAAVIILGTAAVVGLIVRDRVRQIREQVAVYEAITAIEREFGVEHVWPDPEPCELNKADLEYLEAFRRGGWRV